MPSLRWIIKRQQIARETIENEFTIHGEPIIYSVKYNLNNRHDTMNFFQRKMHKTMLKAVFPSYLKSKTPVVLKVRFYVSPPSCESIKSTDLKRERKPATRSFELCDYLLAFLEILRGILINTYRQIVHVDAKKYYSDNPRTVFQFMSWEHYGKLQTGDPIYTETKKVCRAKHASEGVVQSERSSSQEDQSIPQGQLCGSYADGSIASDTTSFATDEQAGEAIQEATDAPIPPHKAPRRRQSREVPI